MSKLEASVIADSVGLQSPRLTSFLLMQPRIIHAEFLRHRMLSFSAASSRAIPVDRLLKESIANMFMPKFYENQKGMQGYTLLSPPMQRASEDIWERLAYECARHVKVLSDPPHNVHKQHANRPLEWFGWIKVMATGTEDSWLNFFGLRLDRAAMPEIRALAELMWAAWNESTPKVLQPGDWHLPFIDQQAIHDCGEWGINETRKINGLPTDAQHFRSDALIRVSVARCARLSYTSFDTGKRSAIDEDLALYQRLVGSTPMHASPAEHQATPDEWVDQFGEDVGYTGWAHPQQHGNLPGWRQYRKTLPGERIAPLPEGYVYVRKQ